MGVAQVAFSARISDPTIGGTYMTMLNSIANLGRRWPNALMLWAVDHLTWKRCQFNLKNVKSSNIRYLKSYEIVNFICFNFSEDSLLRLN